MRPPPACLLPLLLPALIVGACARVPPGDQGGASGAPPDSSAALSDAIPTVVTVSWDDADAPVVHVEFGATAAYGRIAVPTAESPTRAVLVGSPADTDVHWRLVVEQDGALVAGPDQVIHTGALPPTLPTFSVEHPTTDDWQGFLLVPAFDATRAASAIVLVDRDANVVWWTEVGMFVPSARLSREGDVLFRTDGLDNDHADGAVFSVDWTGEDVLVRAEDDAGHHDFIERADGTLVTIDAVVSTWEGQDIVGDRIVEHHPDGSTRVVWDAFEALEPTLDPRTATYTPSGYDWTHANGIDHDPVADRYLLSLYHPQTVLAIDATTGETAWTLGRSGGEFSFFDDPGFGPQHAPSFVDGGVLLFDNHNPTGKPDDPVQASRAVRYALDLGAGSATPVWEWAPQASLITGVLGDARLLTDGSVLVNDGMGGALQVVSPEGDQRLSFQAPEGWMLGRGAALSLALTSR